MKLVLHLPSIPCPSSYPVDPYLCAKGTNHKPFKFLLKQVPPIRYQDYLPSGLKNRYV